MRWRFGLIPLVLAAAPGPAAEPLPLPLPIPPIPPLIAPSSQPAPVPDQDVAPPHPGDDPKGATIGPDLFQPQARFYGNGYEPGSTVQGEQERRLRPTPGFYLKMPLQ
jgi:hypothetical protein